MEPTARPSEGAPGPGCGESRLWLLPWCGLVAWHAWMTLALFGPERPRDGLLDDRPVVSGRHPLHLYHGALGASAFLRHGTLSCYDPAFQAGYPKTPVFDAGSRPAELFLALAGSESRPAAYKLGLAASWLLAPFALAVAARGIGLTRRAVLLATLLGLLVWWGRPCRQALDEGDADLLLAGLCAAAQAGLLVRFDRRPRARDWLGIVGFGCLGWFAHPLLFTLLLPLGLIYYLTVGARHAAAWSLLLLGGLAAAVACNLFWLDDWVRFWWLRVPLGPSDFRLPHRTPATLWRADLWGDPVDRGIAVLLLAAGAAGAGLLNQSGRRAAARLFGLGALVMVCLAVGGVLSESLGRLEVPNLLIPGLLLAAPLAAHGVEAGWSFAIGWLGVGRTAALAAGAGAALLAAPPLEPLADRATAPTPLALGLRPWQEQVVCGLREYTTDAARILWEDRPKAEAGGHWTCLLPTLTGRHFVGGLDPEGGIEHTADGLTGRSLGGRPLDEWTDADLDDYCTRYNVGWVVCWSPPAVRRFEDWTRAEQSVALPEGGRLYALNRPHSFILKGRARWLKAEPSRIALADVEPENGEVVLSLHFQEGLTVSPGRVRVEKREDEHPIPLIRLRVDAPVARVTLTWQR